MRTLAVLVVVLILIPADIAFLRTDTGHDLYCWGRIAALDPIC